MRESIASVDDCDIRSRIIVALDEHSLSASENIMDILRGQAVYFKVGLQLFTSAGPDSVKSAKERGANVFLDLKLHDIPNTVASAVRSARNLGVDLCTIHLSGGREMCAAAVSEAGDNMQLLGVTVLTSANESTLKSSGVSSNIADHVMRLAEVGHAAGVHGFVSSAWESANLRKTFGPSALLAIPGVRRENSGADDQRRTATAAEAVKAGADFLVIGRPITRAEDPAAAFRSFVAEISTIAR